MRGGLAIFLVLALTGCGTFGRRNEAPVADADPQCFQACAPSLEDTGLRWEVDPEDPKAWDALGTGVLKALTGALLTCERRRQACTDFIDSLRKRGVIRGAKP